MSEPRDPQGETPPESQRADTEPGVPSSEPLPPLDAPTPAFEPMPREPMSLEPSPEDLEIAPPQPAAGEPLSEPAEAEQVPDESATAPSPEPSPEMPHKDWAAQMHKKRERFESLRDNFEAFAIAIVMALVIKHFCVEAFKIPTGSMYPTLYGKSNYEAGGVGDRILVDKFAYVMSDPERWHIVVFRYPLQRRRNFIKRVTALPGETLRIWDGDVWIRRGDGEPFRQARKPRRVRGQMFLPVYPGDDLEAIDVRRSFRTEGARSGWQLEDPQRFVFTGGERANLYNQRPVLRNSTAAAWVAGQSSAGRNARDLRARFRIEMGPPGEGSSGLAQDDSEFSCSWQTDDGTRSILVLAGPGGRSHVRIERNGEVIAQQDLDSSLRARAHIDVDFEFVDGDLRVHLDDKEVAVLDAQRRIDSTTTTVGSGQELRFSARGHPLTVSSLALFRDIWYENDFVNRRWNTEGLTVPENAFFMLGDNSGSSSDSRKWRLSTIRLKDGSLISYDNSRDRDDDYRAWFEEGKSWTQLRDHQGVLRRWSDDQEIGSVETQSAPFVWRELILGRAFVTFWPLTPEFPGRLGWVH